MELSECLLDECKKIQRSKTAATNGFIALVLQTLWLVGELSLMCFESTDTASLQVVVIIEIFVCAPAVMALYYNYLAIRDDWQAAKIYCFGCILVCLADIAGPPLIARCLP